MAHFPEGGGGCGGVAWVNFYWACATGLSEPIPHYSLFWGQYYYRPHLSHFWENNYVIFVIPCDSVTFYFYELTHGDYFTFHFHL